MVIWINFKARVRCYIVLLLELSKQCMSMSGLGHYPAETESITFIQKPRFQYLG